MWKIVEIPVPSIGKIHTGIPVFEIPVYRYGDGPEPLRAVPPVYSVGFFRIFEVINGAILTQGKRQKGRRFPAVGRARREWSLTGSSASLTRRRAT